MINFIRNYGLYFAWVIACIGTLISIFYSYILNVEPCILCYYQRICLFPLTFILGMAAYHNDSSIKLYVLPQAVIGLGISIYQVFLQEMPGMQLDICGRVSCSTKIFLFSYVTIPMASVVAFGTIVCLLVLVNRNIKRSIG
ncbi:Thiol-disulfide oxidoreductase C,putative disulfide oxidoreductase,Disulfide bond formation protein DsbB [Chlamydia serpentis]|uniref:Probable disulfide formation protein n=1 Tax=Chlamydia serpentis TaxID=1967782 RepID=A0A2R8FAU8_9CHLA|nr:disulfide bond formation protein B [Chlamydia serpentis]SPN73377.1 Thiol-disulfide oxidoreductase C,putative disulfide oxidoreductase,Disulfide bond formation protein DsbB [Chlamydia serpentis]